jgi:hypothetical protein
MWRSKIQDFPYGHWEPWGVNNGAWGWGNANENWPVLPGRYGELSFRFLQGNCVLSFFDVDNYQTSALTVVNPTDDWTTANRVDYAHGQDFSQLYGGYIAPASRLNQANGMKFAVSQWNTSNNDPYWVVRFDDTLLAQGPLIEAPPKPIPLPKPEPVPPLPISPLPGAPMTPQELYELLLRELSASGSVKITTPEGDQLTLREAIEQIFWKERGWHDLRGGRPRHPSQQDDQLGQVLSMRAEGLFTQALLYELAKKSGIDVASVYKRVQDSLK